MIEILLVAAILGIVIVSLWYGLSKTMNGSPGPNARPNIYDDSYTPGIPGSMSGPLPIGQKKGTKK